jgi:hypothetical protein
MNQRTAKDGRVSVLAAQTEKLSYSVELWDRDAQALERVLARAFSPQLARAIFRAAQKEHPDQRILLRRGTRTIADSAD